MIDDDLNILKKKFHDKWQYLEKIAYPYEYFISVDD